MLLSQTETGSAPYRKLAELLPLHTPMTLMVDPANACNFKCTFCPTGDDDLLRSAGRPLGLMRYELFCKIIDDLNEFPDRVQSLRLYKDGEPFLNKRLPEMVRYAKAAAVAQEIYVITNGSVLSDATAAEIVEAGLDRIRVSVEHVSSEGYKALTKTFSDYDAVLRNVRRLFEAKRARRSSLHIDVKIIDTGLGAQELAKFKTDFGPVADTLSVETLMGWSDSSRKDWTLGTGPVTGIDGFSPLDPVEVCPQPFKGLAVNFDGTVSVCCVDWSHGTVVGDLRTERLRDVWNGPKLREFRLLHLKGRRREIPVCADCQYVNGHHPLSRLDRDADVLLERYSQAAAGGPADGNAPRS